MSDRKLDPKKRLACGRRYSPALKAQILEDARYVVPDTSKFRSVNNLGDSPRLRSCRRGRQNDGTGSPVCGARHL